MRIFNKLRSVMLVAASLFCLSAVFAVTTSLTSSSSVAAAATAVTLDAQTADLKVAETLQLTATLTPADCTDAVVWSSTDAAVASVADGLITAVAEGTAQIIATCGEVADTCDVAVAEAETPADPGLYATKLYMNFRDASQFASEIRVAVASLSIVADTTTVEGVTLYESTDEQFSGLIFEPAANDGTQSWWLRKRNTGTDYGLAAINQTRWFAVKGMKPGYKVTIEAKSAMPLADSTAVEIVKNEATTCGQGVSYTYTVLKDCNLAFQNSGCYMYLIKVEAPAVMTTSKYFDFRDANTYATDTHVLRASLTIVADTTSVEGITLYESTDEQFSGLIFEPSKDDSGNSWWLRKRNTGTDYGLAAINQTRWFAVKDCKAGDKVTIEAKSAMTLADSSLVTVVKNESTACGYGVSYTYTVLKDCNLSFQNSGCYMYVIKVETATALATLKDMNFRDADAFATDTHVMRASLSIVADTTTVEGITLYESTNELFSGLIFEPTKDDNGNSWWLRKRNTGTDYGLAAINQSRWFAVKDCKAGYTVTIESKSAMPLADSTAVDFVQNAATECGYGVSYTYTVKKNCNLAFYNSGCYMYKITVVGPEIGLASPVITLAGGEDEVNTVTITCATKGSSIFYKIDNKEEVEYTAPFTVDKSCTIAAYSVLKGTKSNTVRKEVVAGYIVTPTATITKVEGTKRTVTLASATEGATITYVRGVESSATLTYAEPFVIEDTVTVFAVAQKNGFISDTLTAVLAAGTEIQLGSVTYAKADYADSTQLSKYVLTADQSAVLCTPIPTIHYTLPNGTEGVCASGDTLQDLPLGLLKAYATADGYVTSEETHIWMKAPIELQEVWSVDFDTLCINGYTSDPVLGAVAVTVDGVDMCPITVGDTLINENFVVQSGSKWLMRYSAGKYVGLYQFNSGDRSWGILNLFHNQIVKVTFSDPAGIVSTNETLTEDVSMSDGNCVAYKVAKTGDAKFLMTRYYYIDKIAVYNDPSVTQEVQFAVSKCDGNNRYVAMTSGTEGADIYYRTRSLKVDTFQHTVIDTTVIMKIDSTVVADAFVYDTTYVQKLDTIGDVPVYDTTYVWSEYTAYTEPVYISETTTFGAYAWYQDVESDETTATIEAGTTVQIAQPVIKYVASTEAGKQFEITVDNSDVVSAPTTPIYYTLPGGEETLYEGVITVPADVYGWMTAVSKLEGYDASEAASRYVDSRASYSEVYEAVTATSTVMPTAAADLEFANAPSIDVAQDDILKVTGRIYFHRTMVGGYNNLVLPFNMTSTNLNNGTVYVTDAKGNVLTRGVDYTVYKMSSKTSDTDYSTLVSIEALSDSSLINTANIVNNTNYLLKVADQYVGEDLIFVSLTGAQIAIAQNTFTQPETGWKYVSNKRFQTVTTDFPVYLINKDGSAFERKAAGTAIPAFTTAIIADSTFTDSVKSILLIAPTYADYYVKTSDVITDDLAITSVPGIKMTYGNQNNAGGAVWNAVKSDSRKFLGFTFDGYISGTGNPKGNGNKTGYTPDNQVLPDAGTYVVFEPEEDGTIDAAVIANNGKNIYLTDNGVAIPSTYYPEDVETELAVGAKLDVKYYGFITFDVQAGHQYYLFCTGSKLSYYGFNYTKKSAVGIETITVDALGNGAIYDMMGRKVNTIKNGEIYLQDGKKFIKK